MGHVGEVDVGFTTPMNRQFSEAEYPPQDALVEGTAFYGIERDLLDIGIDHQTQTEQAQSIQQASTQATRQTSTRQI